MKITEELLAAFRLQGDHAADELVGSLFHKYGHKLGSILMPFLGDFDTLNFEEQDTEVLDFFEKNAVLPNFFDLKDTIRATDFFKTYQTSIGIILGCYSLPYCYLGEDGARVLGFSGRIESDTYNRLQETGKFVKNVMNFRVWDENKAAAMILKVRLMHAFWRFMVMKTGKWDMSWGLPVNQEDMLGTNLAFSLIVLRGLKKLGFQIDEVSERAYFKHWAVIGSLLGIDTRLLVLDIKEAIWLDKLIAKRQFRASEIGKKLTASLANSYKKLSDNEVVLAYFNAQSRMFLGDQYADFLGVPLSKYPKTLLKTINSTSTFLSNIYT
jgi:hypothetical protein